MIHGHGRFTRILVEPGPHGPERHVHTEARDFSEEEAAAFRARFEEVGRNPERLLEALAEAARGGRSELLMELFPQAKEFIEDIRSRIRRGF